LVPKLWHYKFFPLGLVLVMKSLFQECLFLDLGLQTQVREMLYLLIHMLGPRSRASGLGF